MGVKPNAVNSEVVTASHLTADIDWLSVDYLPVGEHELSIRHDGLTKTTLTNTSEKILKWQPWFYGRFPVLNIDGVPMEAEYKIINGQTVSYVDVSVGSNETKVVERP